MCVCVQHKYRQRACLTGSSAHDKHLGTQRIVMRRSEGATAVLAMMQAAVDELGQGSSASVPGSALAASNGITALHSEATVGAHSGKCPFARALYLI